MKKNITRENVNSFENSVADVCDYLKDLVEAGEEPTPLELYAMGYLCTIHPTFERLFSNAPITHTQRSIFPPEFSAEMKKYEAIMEANDGNDSEEARNQFMKAMLLAPDWFNDMARDIANEMGLLPKEVFCLEDGTKVFTPEQVAERLGVPVEEVLKGIDQMRDEQDRLGLKGADAYLVDSSKVQKFH